MCHVKTAVSINLSANGNINNNNNNKRPRQKKTEGKERLGFAAADKLRLKILVNDRFDAVSEFP